MCIRDSTQPDVMADHNDDDDNQEDRQLLGDRALVCQRAEGGADEYGQDGDDDTCLLYTSEIERSFCARIPM